MMQFCYIIIKRKEGFSPQFFSEKIQTILRFIRVTISIGQTFNLHEFQMVSDIHGHPI